jgi:hypothetical protein
MITEELYQALRRMTSECQRYLEEKPISEAEMYGPERLSALEQARQAMQKYEESL